MLREAFEEFLQKPRRSEQAVSRRINPAVARLKAEEGLVECSVTPNQKEVLAIVRSANDDSSVHIGTG